MTSPRLSVDADQILTHAVRCRAAALEALHGLLPMDKDQRPNMGEAIQIRWNNRAVANVDMSWNGSWADVAQKANALWTQKIVGFLSQERPMPVDTAAALLEQHLVHAVRTTLLNEARNHLKVNEHDKLVVLWRRASKDSSDEKRAREKLDAIRKGWSDGRIELLSDGWPPILTATIDAAIENAANEIAPLADLLVRALRESVPVPDGASADPAAPPAPAPARAPRR